MRKGTAFKFGFTRFSMMIYTASSHTHWHRDLADIGSYPGAAEDYAGNESKAIRACGCIDVNTSGPTPTITGPSPNQNDAPFNGNFDVTVDFGEIVTGFATDDITLEPSTLASVDSINGGTNGSYTVTITPEDGQEGELTISMVADRVQNTFGNNNEASASSVMVTVDKKQPTPTIDAVSGTQSDEFDITINFDEDVGSFFDSGRVTVSTQSGDAMGTVSTTFDSPGDKEYTVAITPSGMGTLRISLLSGAFQDVAGNESKASAAHVDVSVDLTRPTTVITGPPSNQDNAPFNDNFDVTIDFGETVTGFATNDITLAPNTLASVDSINGGTNGAYTVTITPEDGQDGELTIKVEAHRVEDSVGNTNKVSNTESVPVDKKKPTIESITGEPTTPTKDPFILEITFSEAVKGFSAGDLLQTINDVSGLAGKAKILGSDGDTVHQIRITPNNNRQGSTRFRVPANTLTDLAGNNNVVSSDTALIHMDRVRPNVQSIFIPTDPQNDEFDVMITFSEDVNNFVVSDITLGGTATYTKSLTGSDDAYTLTITPTASGTVTITVPVNIATDDAGNNNRPASTTKTVNVDVDAPTVQITGVPTIPQNAPFNLTITFNEDVTGFTTDDLTVTGGVATATAVSGGPAVYTATITPNANAEGDVTVKVKEDAVQDLALNDNTASVATSSVHVDTIKPTPAITGPTMNQNNAPFNAPFNVTIDFGEAVSGFATNDITLAPNTLASVDSINGGTNGSYTVTITPEDGQQGELTISMIGGIVQDDATNPNEASNSVMVPVDNKKPTILSFHGIPSVPQKDPFDVTITFSESVMDLARNNITLSPSTLANRMLSGSGDTRIVRIRPTIDQQGEVTIMVGANAVEDTAGNGNDSLTSDPVPVDKKVPTVVIDQVPTDWQNGPFDLRVTISEDVTTFVTPRSVIPNNRSGNNTAPYSTVDWQHGVVTPMAGSQKVYTLTLTPNDGKEDETRFKISGNSVLDPAGNKNPASAWTTYVPIDTIKPEVESYEYPGKDETAPATEPLPYDVTITFTEDVEDFTADDLMVGGPVTVTRKHSNEEGNAYTLRVRLDTQAVGDVTISVLANGVTDKAGNMNILSQETFVGRVDNIPPTVMITVPTDRPQKGPFGVTFTFDEDVFGFLPTEVNLMNATGSPWATGMEGPREYMFTVTPTIADGATGRVRIQLDTETVQDGSNLGNLQTAWTDVQIDKEKPTVVISAPTTPQNGTSFDVTFTFLEDVTDFTPNDVVVTNAGKAGAWSSGETPTTYTLTLTPTATAGQKNTVTIDVPADAAMDVATNGNEAATQASVFVDKAPPTVAIDDVPDTEQKGAYDLTIRFSESVNGFSLGDLTIGLVLEAGVTSATPIAAVTLKSGVDGDSVYVLTVTPNTAGAEGDVTVTVNANTVTDFATNANEVGSNPVEVHVDTIVPTVEISDVPDIEKNVAFDLTVTFSEDVTGFATDDLTVTGEATATAVAGGPAVYTATITPNAISEGDVTVTVKANAVQDSALNFNTPSVVTPPVHVDTIVPMVEISGVPAIEKNVAFDLTVTFSEEVNGFTVPADLTLEGPAAASLKSGVDGGLVYVVTITPNAISEGDVTVTVNVSTVQDFALNFNTPSVVTPPVHVDTIVPRVEISGVPTIEKNVPFDLTVTFSEEVNGFTVPADVAVPGPATASLKSGADGDSEYVVTITPNTTSEGNVTVRVNANTVQDFARNANTDPSDVTPSVHIDTIVPTVTSISPPPAIEKNIPFDLTVTFSEPVNGFRVPADVTVIGPATASLKSGANGDSVYTVTIAPNATSEGDVTFRVNDARVRDLALNPNTPSAPTRSVHIDTIRPTVRFEDVPVLEKRNDIFDIKVIFSEAVNGFQVPADITIEEPVVTAVLTSGSDGDAEYTLTITPNLNAKGDLTFQVNAARVQDLALNNNTPSEVTDAVRVDTVPPIAEITDLPTIAGAPFDVTITFSEEVTGFTTEDIGLTGPATAALKSGVDGDTIYTATITPDPNARGDVRILIPAEVVQDLALNDNISSETTPPVQVDTNALTVQITDVPQTVQLGAFSVMIKFSMEVADFVLADITIGGDAAIQTLNLTGRGSVYLLEIIPETDTDGDVTIQVPAGVATDAASNSNAVSVLQTVSIAPKWMPEADLRDAARAILGLDAGEDFERDALKELTTLTVESSDISSLTGLEAATNLKELDLSGNTITDIALLQDLTELTTLDLSGNAITDITPLAQFTELTTLDLGGNAIADITPLAELTELTTLDLSGNTITDIIPLAELTQLTTLNLSNNPISSLEPLSALTSLTTLGLSGNAITDLTLISDLTGLLILNLSDNAIIDITLLQNLTALTTLDLSGNTVSNLMPLTGLTQLSALYLNNNTVSDLTALGGLTNLMTLELAGNAIGTLNPIATLQQLTLLDLSANNISDVSTLASLASLTTLRLTGNPILNTVPLYPLTQRIRPVDIDIAVSQYPPWDVNEDGTVDALDSALVTAALGQSGDAIIDPRTDVNGDGIVDNTDLTLVTDNLAGGCRRRAVYRRYAISA